MTRLVLAAATLAVLCLGPAAVAGEMTARPLPAGYAWEESAAGHGLRGPSGDWYVRPNPENTRLLRNGSAFVPNRGYDGTAGSPLGTWDCGCVREGSCAGPVVRRVLTGQDGQPTDPAVQDAGAFDPNDYPGGWRCTPTCPTPTTSSSPLASRTTCGPGGCVVRLAASPPPPAPAPVGAPPCPGYSWRHLPAVGWGWVHAGVRDRLNP